MSKLFNQTSRLLLLTVFAFGFLSGCQKASEQSVSDENLVRREDTKADRKIGDPLRPYSVLGTEAFKQKVTNGSVFTRKSPEYIAFLQSVMDEEPSTGPSVPAETTAQPAERAPSLMIGFPVGLLKEHQMFGGVITAVTDQKSELLGGLKLTDLPPIHVRPGLARTPDNDVYLVLSGCVSECTESSTQSDLLPIPVAGVDPTAGTLLLDLSSLGAQLNLIQMLDPEGKFTSLKTKSSAVTSVDYSGSTLVFDIKATMIPVEPPEDGSTPPETVFTVRWYLRLMSAFNPAFTPRTATPGVGFFMTDRAKTPLIQRWSTTTGESDMNAPVKYYIKNVPEDQKPAFSAAFDNWNAVFERTLGKKLLSYEFVDATDPRAKLLVPGDVRYNILEWDLVNLAGYGGLGPSIANQYTGEMLSANVLVQGPKIMEIYTKWYGVSAEARQMRESGFGELADQLLAQANKEFKAQLESHSASSFKLSLGKKLAFRMNSQLHELEDPADSREPFEEVPQGVSFKDYMFGYFVDLVSHELGHNMGLRHNFRGNLSGAPLPVAGQVSHSIMEYLNREFRYLDKIGVYDHMAINYGYAGVLPERTDMFCTDENVANEQNLGNSAECSRDDATNDPFAFFERRLRKVVKLVTAPDSVKAPLYKVDELKAELATATNGLALYAATADKTAANWTNFFNGGDRPATPAAVKGYVLEKLKGVLCDAKLAEVVAAKEDASAKEATEKNITALRGAVSDAVAKLSAFSAQDLSCQ